MAASYPDTIKTFRTKANKTGVVYDENKSTVLFAEDFSVLEDEVVALETFFRFPTSLPAAPVAGSAYFTVVDFTLHVYTGAAWKTTVLS